GRRSVPDRYGTRPRPAARPQRTRPGPPAAAPAGPAAPWRPCRWAPASGGHSRRAAARGGGPVPMPAEAPAPASLGAGRRPMPPSRSSSGCTPIRPGGRAASRRGRDRGWRPEPRSRRDLPTPGGPRWARRASGCTPPLALPTGRRGAAYPRRQAGAPATRVDSAGSAARERAPPARGPRRASAGGGAREGAPPGRGPHVPVRTGSVARADLDRLRLAAVDLDLVRLGRLGDGNRHGEHAVVVASLDVTGVERLTETYTAGERPMSPLAGDHVRALLGRLPAPLRLHGEHVPLDRGIDRVGSDTRQVDPQLEVVVPADGIHRHPRRASRAPEESIGEPVDTPERVVSHQHRCIASMDGSPCFHPVLPTDPGAGSFPGLAEKLSASCSGQL